MQRSKATFRRLCFGVSPALKKHTDDVAIVSIVSSTGVHGREAEKIIRLDVTSVPKKRTWKQTAAAGVRSVFS